MTNEGTQPYSARDARADGNDEMSPSRTSPGDITLCARCYLPLPPSLWMRFLFGAKLILGLSRINDTGGGDIARVRWRLHPKSVVWNERPRPLRVIVRQGPGTARFVRRKRMPLRYSRLLALSSFPRYPRLVTVREGVCCEKETDCDFPRYRPVLPLSILFCLLTSGDA
ncbi:hypothetical protein BaRGS_00038165 [Batillaria attramentaria]|uniref:Uncharacterized protein n=1 Tax=Batillaria attramentaria TaxID=370345 RepID=A0ABD0J6M4_9CAEN